ncbi:MAG: transcriptional regulator, MerR family [Candidatus Solibacter sp.]|nr:transcriptional regulator, MerR family [Candidatus Solibacter sp.]
MQTSISAMKKYYSDEAWEQHRRYYEEGPSAEWRDLYTDARALLNSDAAGDEAQALVQRCYDLSRRARSGNPEVQTDSPEAWMDRANWPEAMKQRAAEFQMPRVISFIRRAELTSRKSCFSARTWAKMVELSNLPEEEKAAQWRSKVELFHDLEGALGEDPVGEIAQALVARWRAQLDWFTGGDAEIKAHLRTGWSRRRYWPDSQHWQIERLHMMSYERFERAADFLDRAIAAADAPKVQ